MCKKLLSINSLSKSFADIKILKNVSFDVAEGEYVAIVGPNGAGKSTLIKEVLNNTKAVALNPCLKQCGFGYLSQINTTVKNFPCTVKEILRSAQRNRISFIPWLNKKADKELAELASSLSISDLLDKSYMTLSGGQKRRILLARALLTGSKLLVFDEPVAGLDTVASDLMYKTLKKLNEDGITILMISHDLKRICKEASRIIYLNHEIRFDGSASDFEKTSYFEKLQDIS
ncbi:MAG: metal ABC transporter ATP-binding protein [Succinivibrio sp.]